MVNKKKILIVEDEEVISNMLKDKFSLAGFDIDQAMDGEVALKKVRKDKFDIVLLDILMPKMHGLDVLVHIKKDADIMTMPVIILTALDSTERKREAKKLGAVDYLVKSSYSLDDIVQKVRDSIK